MTLRSRRLAQFPARCFGVLASCALVSTAVGAAVGLSFSVDSIAHDDWQIQGITIAIESAAATAVVLNLQIADVQLPDAQGRLRRLELHCAVVQEDDRWHCREGRLRAAESPVGAQTGTWSGFWADDGAFSIQVPELRIAGGQLRLTVSREGPDWKAELQANRLKVAQLSGLLGSPAFPRDWDARGTLSGTLDLGGAESGAMQASAELVVDRFGYASPGGAQAAENLVLRLDLAARERRGTWRFDSTLRWPSGALYSEPVFVDAAAGPLTAVLSGRFDSGRQLLELDSWSVTLDEALTVSGAGWFDTGKAAIRELTVAAHSDDANRVYALLLQPFLLGTPADDMAVSGSVGFVLHFDDAGIEQAGLTLNRVAMADRKQRFALHPTDGSVAWQRAPDGTVSTLRVEGVTLLGIRSGGFDARATFEADKVTLLEPIVVPLLDGRVALDRFTLTGALVAGARPKWTASASVRDVSLERLTRELGWPPFSGTLTGELTDMQYVDRVFSIGGGLRLAAFDGEIRVNDLRIQDPLGAVPVLHAHATLRGLNLEALTRTFAFGRIEGRLDGDVQDLQLVAWQPDRFDLHLYTPPDDTTRRRISQRAVENLTALGSGVPAGLSASFLSIFKDFSYDAISAKVRLTGDTAQIDGLARKDGGYYLVRGSGLPRIDVIGRNRRVAWNDLVERLQKIQVEGAKIE